MNLFQEDVNKAASWLNISNLERSLKLQIFYPCNMGLSYAILRLSVTMLYSAYIFNKMKIKKHLQRIFFK